MIQILTIIMLCFSLPTLSNPLQAQYPTAWAICQMSCVDARKPETCIKIKGYTCGVLATKGVFYGNYCGIGNFAPAQPINDTDRACQKHDQCWIDQGDWSCQCDRELARATREISSDRAISPQEREYAQIIATFWDESPCVP